MPPISQQKKNKIVEQILYYLFSISPNAVFTNVIANEVARDEEFTKSLLLGLRKQGLVLEVNKNPNGKEYQKRQRWRLSDAAYKAYSKHNH
jgi:predicted transcriptional regulator with HTH domain